jgi:hypothetical protein
MESGFPFFPFGLDARGSGSAFTYWESSAAYGEGWCSPREVAAEATGPYGQPCYSECFVSR